MERQGAAGAPVHRSVTLTGMKAGTLAGIAAAAAVAVVAFAVHLELSARARVDNELRALRTQVSTDLDQHRISASRAAVLDSRLGQVRRQIREDDVRHAQKLLDGVKAALESRTRSA